MKLKPFLLPPVPGLKTILYSAGHAQTSTTANIYSHVIRTVNKMAADVPDDIQTPAFARRSFG